MSSYYIYRISEGASNLVRKLEKIDRFDSFRDAKAQVKQLRIDQPAGEKSIFKIIFAESELDAEEKLNEKREAPIVQEWEK